MKKFKILIPCYNDWQSLFKLLNSIDNNTAMFDAEFTVLIVNDCSTEKMPKPSFGFKKIKSIDLINIKKNQGHTRCNATGIKYLSEKKNFDYMILMDGDGEDNPDDLPLIIKNILKNKNISVVATRKKRSEGLLFTILYNLHKIITLIFTGKNMNFGHYCCLTRNDVILLSSKKTLWSNFAGAAKKFIPNLSGVPTIRGLRYFGPSKMPLTGLIIHSMSIIASFKYQVLFRSLLFIFLFSFLYLKIYDDNIFLILNFLIGFFCAAIFFISKRESPSELENCQQRIKNIENIHTTRL
tara:strand:+ start:516 stop:1403 length:888 start_codon:yes stop_codon:yes gene_type:complete